MKRRGARELFEAVATWADRHSPQTLFARALIIIVVPMLLLQALSAWWFYSQRGDNVTNRLALLAVRDLRALIALHDQFPDSEHRAWIVDHARTDMFMSVRFRPGRVPPFRSPEHFDIVAREMQGALDADLRKPYYLDNTIGGDQLFAEIQLTPDTVMEVYIPYLRLTFGSSFAYVLAQVGLALVLFGLAIWFMRRELVPIEHLGVAADALGKGRDVPDFAFKGGTREVRNAATAFQTMKIRLGRSIQQRTEMLAGVSHDLRTPLTRMKLALALMPESLAIDELKSDVVEMERMVQGYLDFARGEGAESPVETDIRLLLEEIVATAKREGADILLSGPDEHVMPLRPNAMKRCIGNLVANARRHAIHVWLAAVPRSDGIDILVDDDGPGIPSEQREAVFRPFFRLDRSRNVATGGVGLGLTIARDVARGHGGDLVLETSPQGGLRARIQLPN
jgi:two-component system osmolarity sensor histidine kinase EnvZ